MPKRVDPDERRRLLTDALARIAARDGLDAVTMREVAAEAGVSVGFVQHYFASKDELLLAALGEVAEQVGQRVAAAVAALPSGATERERIRAIVLQFLPLDDEGRAAAVMFRALHAGGVNNPDTTGAEAFAVPMGFDRMMRRRLTAARRAGELRPDVDIPHEALLSFLLVISLGDALLAGMISAERAVETVDYALSRALSA
jgi:TetR/AcrR family transcriptional regulator, transcriptional repressor of bet genes